jgi:hypothetical protein
VAGPSFSTLPLATRSSTALRTVAGITARHLMRGQTNFFRMLWKFNSVFDPRLQLADHARPVRYEMALPPPHRDKVDPKTLYIHRPQGRKGRAVLDDTTERFVDETRMGTSLS